MNINKLFKDKLPNINNWIELKNKVQEFGLKNKYLQAIAPNASTGYIQNSSSSIMPFMDKVEIRQQGKLGRIYYPAPFITKENEDLYESAYDIDQTKMIDVYATAQKWIDQGISMNLYIKDNNTTRDLNKLHKYCYDKGIKTIYYTRLKKKSLFDNNNECENCSV